MIASQARLKSKLTEKGATLPSATMRRKQVSGSTEASELPRETILLEGREDPGGRNPTYQRQTGLRNDHHTSNP